jgi:hypothetical protein
MPARQEDKAMKQTALRMTMAAVAMLASAGLASAQSMTAEIPFAFVVGGARLQPGTYRVHVATTNGDHKLLQVSSLDNRRSILALPLWVSWTSRPGAADVVMSFACTDGKCELASVRGLGEMIYNFPRSKGDHATRIAEVVMRPDRAD